MHQTLVFTTLAMNQTVFFEAVGNALTLEGYTVYYICFHEGSYNYLKQRGLLSINVFQEKISEEDYIASYQKLVPYIPSFLGHEKAAFQKYNSKRLIEKLCRYFTIVDKMLKLTHQQGPNKIWVIQELGGFTSIVATYFAAYFQGIDNIFMEPAFFKKRLFFVKNSFLSLQIIGPTDVAISHEVEKYLQHILKTQEIVIPKKDKLFYRSPLKKIFDLKNAKRFLTKLMYKYIYHQKEEFDDISGHVKRHIRMFLTAKRLSKYYSQLSQLKNFIYYPLHVPADMALTIRSPEYLDQYALIDYICRHAPLSHQVVIKEHPAMVGSVEFTRIKQLLKTHDNLFILSHKTNNFEVLKATKVVVTVNSKTGAEAMLLNKPVIVLGDTFYRSCQFTYKINTLSELKSVLKQLCEASPSLNMQMIKQYFQDIWNHSQAGELYVNDPVNIEAFTRSIKNYLSNHA